MSGFQTLRGRLAVVVSLVVATAFLVTGLAIQAATARQAQQRFDEQLSDRLSELVAATARGRGRPGGASGPGGNTHPDGVEQTTADAGEEPFEAVQQVAERALGRGFFLSVGGPDSGAVTTFGDSPSSAPPAQEGEVAEFVDSSGRRWRTVGQSLPRQGLVLQVGGDVQAFVGDNLRVQRRLMLLLGGLATIGTGVLTVWAVGRSTRSLSELAGATHRVAATEDLSTRVELEDAPAEVRDVADGLNVMLSRLEQSATAQATALRGARRFAADAGHELRTPLTAKQTTLDSLHRNPDVAAEVRRVALDEVATETRRLAGLVASLQTLARLDSGLADLADADGGGHPGLATETVDVADVAGQAVSALRACEPLLDVRLAGADEERAVRGSAPWIRSIVDNLLSNAARHGRLQGLIQVTLSTSPQGIELTVDDDGPGIPPEQRARVFERFIRGADTTVPGSGLGPALVAQLVALHGGSVQIQDSPFGGARLLVRLPTPGL